LHAVASFDSVVLVAGGRNKGLDLSVLASHAQRLRGVVAFGEAAPEVVAAFAGRTEPSVVTVTSMREAVRAAARLARPGDAVLLSPACASFDAYDGYAARGDDFAAEVRAEIATEATRP
jgi:UDP-N-acetylmuramoylalanine--D-glutamate ligase